MHIIHLISLQSLLTLPFAAVKSQVSALKRELDELRTKYSGASDKLQEKNRQYQKLQVHMFASS